MADIVDILVDKTEELVTIDVTTNETIVNISTINGSIVDSVNGQTGDVVLDADDIAETASRFWLTSALKTAYDSAVTWISTNGTNLLNHLSNTSNPHSTTATQVDALQRDGSNANSNINIGEYSLKAGQFELDQSPTGTAGVAITRWNDAIGSTETTLKGGNVVLKNGVDLVARVVNKVTPNTTLTKANYQAVRVSSAQGQRLAVSLAQANNDNNSADTIGLVCETIPTNQEGFIMTVGQLEGINTTGSLQGETWTDGDVLYLSPTTAGRLTNVKPTGATGHIVVIGYVEYAHANNGKIYVKVMNGWELDELHNVNISSPLNNEILTYTSSTQLWENKTVVQALGYTPLPTQAGSTTGTVVTFETDRVYGTIASPETGNITANVTGAQIGVTNIIIHNSGTAPTFGSQFKRLSGSGNYVTSQVNYIYCTFINSTEIIYSINQRT